MNEVTKPSTLKGLRSLTPHRTTTFGEALRVAELQASRMLTLLKVGADGVAEHHIADMPRITIIRQPIPVSGMSHWSGQNWIISICEDDSPARQRFTLLHEFKHIIDHGQSGRLYSTAQQAESAADYFAGCVLVPKTRLKSAWCSGIQNPGQLAKHFGVSEAAILVRLHQTGLDAASDPQPSRCARPVRTPRGGSQIFRVVSPVQTHRRFA